MSEDEERILDAICEGRLRVNEEGLTQREVAMIPAGERHELTALQEALVAKDKLILEQATRIEAQNAILARLAEKNGQSNAQAPRNATDTKPEPSNMVVIHVPKGMNVIIEYQE